MYKLNLVLIVLMCLAVFGGATWLAMGPGENESAPPTVEDLIRDLGDSDPDVRREAQNRLLESGDQGVVALQRAAQSKRRILASRARRLLTRMGESSSVVQKNEEVPGPSSGSFVSEAPFGVHVELSSSGNRQVYVRLVNEQAVPVLVARELVSGRIVCGTFGWFEFEDGGKSDVVAAVGRIEWVAVDPGQGIDIFVGVPVEENRSVRIRFVYDATEEGEYRKLVQPSEKGAPLPPERFISSWMELEYPGN